MLQKLQSCKGDDQQQVGNQCEWEGDILYVWRDVTTTTCRPVLAELHNTQVQYTCLHIDNIQYTNGSSVTDTTLSSYMLYILK